jgi:hypothetical protein
MSDRPWVFGLNQLLTVIGFIITICVAAFGFRTFERWRREQLEERKIQFAIDALSLAYETEEIFKHIRSPMTSAVEYKDMPTTPGESDKDRRARGSDFVVLKRLAQQREFFERAWKLQPLGMALFGPETATTFSLLYGARKEIETASELLVWHRDGLNPESKARYRKIAFDYGTPADDAVGQKLADFKNRIEKLCRPVLDRKYSRVRESTAT